MKNIHFLSLIYLGLFALSFGATAMNVGSAESWPKQTKNGFGMNFAYLGEFEETLLKECLARLKKSSSKLEQDLPRFLFHAEAFGRLPLRVINELDGDAEIFVDELERENIQSFIEEVERLSRENENSIGRNAKRCTTIVCDCLKLHEERTFSEKLQDGFESFDVIVANNLLHFFDGKQILDFLLMNFNMLKPDGKLFLFFYGRPKGVSREQIQSMSGDSVFIASYINLFHLLSIYAQGFNSQLLFPALARDEWLTNKSAQLEYIIKQKPNSSSQNHFILFESIEKIVTDIGFKIDDRSFYAPDAKAHFGKSDYELHSIAFILSKPAECGKAKTTRDLNPQLVDACVNSVKLMEDFINGPGNLKFIAPFPFVEKGTNFCQNSSCAKKGSLRCSGCKNANYCSKDCQIKDWQMQHKSQCKK